MAFLLAYLFIDSCRMRLSIIWRFNSLALRLLFVAFPITLLLSYLVRLKWNPALLLLCINDTRIFPFLTRHPLIPERIRSAINIETACTSILAALCLTPNLGYYPVIAIIIGLILGHFLRYQLRLFYILWRKVGPYLSLVVLLGFLTISFHGLSNTLTPALFGKAILLSLMRIPAVFIALLFAGYRPLTGLYFSIVNPKGVTALIIASFLILPPDIHLSLLLSLGISALLVYPISHFYGSVFTGRDLYSALEEHAPVVELQK
ncbi:MAG: hypothetical protein SP1CHLAM54_08060 [Chlamydiia bacterium]|nr:hypothetical protein [Chlamydiia bacterium]MCH9615712.1 hypothetical protein [Chlamydiia bacterium]MCH9628885.1 hypothetical protein [Chlamydiia bacterium]